MLQQDKTKKENKDMARKTKVKKIENPITVDTEGLKSLLNCGRNSAVEIGKQAGAEIRIGKRLLWNVAKVERYVNAISN